jgi:hypothetical protein
MASVFGALPLSSVWTYVPEGSSGVQFIQNQSEDIFNPNSEIGRREMAQDVEGKSLAEKFGLINSLR